MKLTTFGETARHVRIRLGLSLKEMAEHLKISSSHLSGIEYGEKRLADKHAEAALDFFALNGANHDELNELRRAAEASKDTINTANLTPDAKSLVAAFARRLQSGDAPTPEIEDWLLKRNPNKK